MRFRRLGAWVFGCVLAAATPLHASPITLEFSGYLSLVASDVDHALSVGDPLQFLLTYDPDVATPSARFQGSVAGYGLDIPNINFSPLFGGGFWFEPDAVDLHLPGDLLPGDWGLRMVSFQYRDSSLAFGQLPRSVSPAATASVQLYYTHDTEAAQLNEGVITGIRSVPEPSSLLLLGIGAGALALRRRRSSGPVK